jgi:peroxiredoxin
MKTIVVWFSCGAASAVAAKKTIEKYGKTHTIRVVNNPIKQEHEDNRRFLSDVEKWIGQKIEIAKNSKYPESSIVEIFEKRKYMSGISGAPCTLELKKNARYEWEKNNHHDYLVLGFTSDEIHRHERFKMNERDNILPVLIDENISKQDCFNIIKEAGIKLPEIYNLGFPNANCVGCVKSTSVTYWNLVRNKFPEIFKERSEQSRRLNVKLVRYKGKRIFLDELPVDAKGNKLTKHSIDCGIFCK